MINFLTKRTFGLNASAGIIAIFTFSAQILAVIKSKIFATEFGASRLLDIYNTAFKIPDMIFLLIGMMVSGSILIPFLNSKEKESEKSYKEFINKIIFSFSLFLIFLSLFFYFLMPNLISFFFPGFQGINKIELIKISRLMLISPVIMGISNIFISLNQKNHTFVPVALTGVFYNLSIISSVYLLYPYWGLKGLIFGVIFGATFYFWLQLPSVLKQNVFPKKIKFLSWKELKKYFYTAIPRSLALFVATLVPIFLYSQASKMPAGSITILQFALSLYFVPIGFVTTSYSLASFPQLSKNFTNQEKEKFSSLISLIVSRVLFFVIPIFLFFMFFSPEINGFLFGSRKFNLKNIKLISTIIIIFSPIIFFQSLNIIFSRILYAAKNTSLTMYSNFLSLLMTFIIYWILQNIFESSLFFLALSFLIANIISFLFIYLSTSKKLGDYFELKNIFLLKKILISLFSILITRTLLGFSNVNIQDSFWGYGKNVFLGGVLFLLIFIVFSEIFKEKSYLDFKLKLKKIIKKS